MTDLRDAFRALRATPVVTAVAVLSLALGIGANTAIFSILDSLLLRALPVRQPQRLALVFCGGANRSSWTNPLWEALRAHGELFDGAFAWGSPRFNLARGGEIEPVNGVMASGGYFDVLGVRAILGRTFTYADDVRGGGPDGPVAVISYAFWQRRFGGAADVIGKPLTLDGATVTIIGVTPPAFTGTLMGRAFDVAVPLGVEPLIRGKRDSALDRRSWWWLSVMARLKPGQTIASATAALRGVQPHLREATLPDDWRPEDLKRYLADGFELRPSSNGPSYLRRQYMQPLVTIMVVVALVLVIACSNIANLLLARATARRHELSVRLALGASRWRLARQLLAESLLLSGGGALAGLLFAGWGSRLLVRQLSTEGETVFLDLSLDWRVLGFTAAVTIATAVLFGTAPAFRAAGVAPNDALKEQGRGTIGDRGARLGQALVIAQVALSLVLVVAAGLFVRTFTALTRLPLGFDRDRVLIVDMSARKSAVDPSGRAALYARIRDSVAAVPGVTQAAISAVTPVSGMTWNTTIEQPPGLALSENDRETYVNLVGPGWFATYGTPLLAGRDITPQDSLGTPHVIVVNETFARTFFPGRSPLGQRVGERPGAPEPELEIVGVVKDAVYASLRRPVPPTMYKAAAQSKDPGSSMNVSVRASGPPAALSRSLAAAVTGVDRDVTFTFRPLSREIDGALTQEWIVAMLSGFFGALALLLAGLGLYGVMAYSVSRRRAEIGIRMALGAAPAGVVWIVLRRVAVLVAIGVLFGAAASLWLSRFVAPLLFGLAPRDPMTLAGAIVVLAAVGTLAGWLPARRAARIDPARVLRES